MYIAIALFIAFLGSQLLVTLADFIKQRERNDNDPSQESRCLPHASGDVPWVSFIRRHLWHIILMSIAYGGMSVVALTIATHGLLESAHGWLLGMLCVAVVTLTCVGVAIASRDRIFPKSQQEIFQLLLSELEHSTIRNPRAILHHAIFKGCGFVIIGGSLTGLSMCLAHFGMAAILTMMQGSALKIQESSAIAAACFAIIGSVLCFLLLFRVVSIFPHYEWLKVLTCALFTIITVGTYYLSHGSLLLMEKGNQRSSREDISLTIIQSTCVVFSLAVNHWCAADMRSQIRSKMRRAVTHSPQQQQQQHEENSVIAELSNSIRFRSQRRRQVRVRPVTCVSSASTVDARRTSLSMATVSDSSEAESKVV